MDLFSIRSIFTRAQKLFHSFTSKSTIDASKGKKNVDRSQPSSSSKPTAPIQEPHSAPGAGKQPWRPEKRLEAWAALLARHDKLNSTRLKASDIRRELLRQRDSLSSSLEQLSEQLRVDIGSQENVSLSDSKTSIKAVFESIQCLQAQEKMLSAIEEDLVQQEFQVDELLPRLLGPRNSDITLAMLEKYGFDFPGEVSDSNTSDSRDLDQETADYENEPAVQAYLQKLGKINELEDRLIALRLVRRRAQDEREQERELNGEIDDEVDEFEILDGHEEEHEELVKSLQQARAELEEFRSTSEGTDDPDSVKAPTGVSRPSSTNGYDDTTTTIVATQSQT